MGQVLGFLRKIWPTREYNKWNKITNTGTFEIVLSNKDHKKMNSNQHMENTQGFIEKSFQSPPTEEYLFIRTEILQYLQNYQNVRNMMYIVTATCLGFALSAEVPNPYFYLLPLLVIIPSFLVAINFWKSVRIDAIYLEVFHEKSGSPFQWESRHDRLYEDNPGLRDKINVQYLPYVSCAIVCLAIFWFMALEEMEWFMIGVGAAVTIGCFALWLCNHNLDDQKILEYWEGMKAAEEAEAAKAAEKG